MFEKIIDALEDMLEEIDSLVETTSSLEEMAEPHLLSWSANGSILDGGRSIRMDSFGLEGVHNVYDVFIAISNERTLRFASLRSANQRMLR